MYFYNNNNVNDDNNNDSLANQMSQYIVFVSHFQIQMNIRSLP